MFERAVSILLVLAWVFSDLVEVQNELDTHRQGYEIIMFIW